MSFQLVEAIKEFLRTGVLAAIPVLISGLEAGAVDWRAILIAAVIAVLRAVDKYLHELDFKSPLDLRSLDVLEG